MATPGKSTELIPRNIKVAAVVPSAGQGTRVGSGVPKQHLDICGEALFIHCLRDLLSCERIQEITQSTHEENTLIENCSATRGETTSFPEHALTSRLVYKIVVIIDDIAKGKEHLDKTELINFVDLVQSEGISRHHSILRGLLHLDKDDNRPDIVIIHDGARPIVPHDILRQVVSSALKSGAASSVRPLVSTVVRTDDEGTMQESLVRRNYRQTETPQAFKLDTLLQGYKSAPAEELLHGTECMAMAQGRGGALVEGDHTLWKVTNESDIEEAKRRVWSHNLLLSVQKIEEQNSADFDCIEGNEEIEKLTEMLKAEHAELINKEGTGTFRRYFNITILLTYKHTVTPTTVREFLHQLREKNNSKIEKCIIIWVAENIETEYEMDETYCPTVHIFIKRKKLQIDKMKKIVKNLLSYEGSHFTNKIYL